MERILVGVDGSSASLKAVDLAADLANKYDAELILLTVVPHFSPGVDPALEEYGRLEHIQEPATELALASANTVLDTAREAARTRGANQIVAEPSFGDPAQQIIAAAGDRRVDLIVVGSRGHGRLAGLLLGSVAHKLISVAPCPTVVVR